MRAHLFFGAAVIACAVNAGALIAQDCAPIEIEKILAGDGAANDGFGLSVAVSGDVAIIGAPNDEGGDLGFPGFGAAYIYRFDGSQWVEEVKLRAGMSSGVSAFGQSVDIDGDLAIVGTRLHGDTFTETGSAYIYRFDGKEWIEEDVLIASDAAVNDQFGFSVGISDETAVVSARQDDDNGTNSGSAYVYTYDTNLSLWVESKLTASDGDAFDQFGFSVAIDHTIVVVGAFHDENGANIDAGSAYVFEFDGSGWIESAKLLASDSASNDMFGTSVAVHNGVVVAGASFDDANGPLSGSAYVYRNDGAGYEESKLIASDGGFLDQFGESVSISGDSVLIGAMAHSDLGSASGSAYLFRYDGSTWTQDIELLASDGTTNDMFGGAVAISGDSAVIGAAFEDENGDSAGAAYAFDLMCSANPCPPDLTGNGVLDFFDISEFLAAFSAMDPVADFTGNGIFDFFDISAFLKAFSAGCP